MRRYSVIITPEEGAYIVDVPTLPGCHSVGDTIPEALENIRDAIALYIAVLRERGEPMPEEQEPIQAIQISVAA